MSDAPDAGTSRAPDRPSVTRSIIEGTARVAQGFSVPFRHVFRTNVTEQYPKRILPAAASVRTSAGTA